MYPGNQDDSTRRMPDQGGRAWSETGYRPAQDGSGYPGGGYGGGYPAGAHDGGYDPGYDGGRREAAPRPRRTGPGIDVGKFAGSVVATALVAGIAGWLFAWVVDALFRRFGHEWANGGNTPTMYAIYGAAAALVAGLLWYLLLVGTPEPDRFFGWIVGLLIVAAVVLPLLLVTPFLDGLAAAIVNLGIGLPIQALTGAFGRSFRR